MLLFCKASIFILNIYYDCFRYAMPRIVLIQARIFFSSKIYSSPSIKIINTGCAPWPTCRKSGFSFTTAWGDAGSHIWTIFFGIFKMNIAIRNSVSCPMWTNGSWCLVPPTRPGNATATTAASLLACFAISWRKIVLSCLDKNMLRSVVNALRYLFSTARLFCRNILSA